MKRWTVLFGILGAFLGFFILSPFTMFMSHSFHEKFPMRSMAILDVYSPSFYQWSLPFTAFSFGVGLVVGFLYFLVIQKNKENVKSKNFLELILNSMSEGLVVVDRDFKILMNNKAFADLAKTSSPTISEKYCYQVSHQLDVPCHKMGEDCAIFRTFLTGKPSSSIHKHIDMEGTEYLCDTRSYPILEPDGHISSALEVIRDITEQKKTEEMFLQAQKMEAVGTLASGVAHDFNNILTTIIGFSEIALLKSQDPITRKYLKTISEAGDKAATLIRQLLAFSRKQKLDIKPTDANNLIDGLTKMLDRLLSERVKLHFKPDPSLATIYADPGQIEQVLMNLAVNARDAMPDGGEITIATSNYELKEEFTNGDEKLEPGSYVIISFSDNGEGIDRNTIKHIFEPFYTTKLEGAGTGLGLATVFGVVKQHDGHITVTSEIGKGTTFKIYLPQIADEIIETSAETSELSFRYGSERILIVDDDPSIRLVLIESLESFGYQIDEASGGDEALRIARNSKKEIDLLITDMVMPGMTGYDLILRFKKQFPSTKIILMSGYSNGSVTKSNFNDHKILFLQKPITPSLLHETLAEVFD